MGATRGRDAERGVTVLYHEHYAALVRLAGLLVPDLPTAEAIVQDAFVAVHTAWRTLPDSAAALGYLHRSVVTSSRAVPQPDGAGGAAGGRSGPAVIAALMALPAQQREAAVLHYYVGLPSGQIAEVMGVHEDAAQQLAARAGATLRAVLDI